jgi:hypothetical protein
MLHQHQQNRNTDIQELNAKLLPPAPIAGCANLQQAYWCFY